MKSYRIKSLILKNLGAFWFILANGETLSTPKRENEKVSGIGTCKFEFSAVKTTIKTYIIDILDKSSEKPQNGVFLALKVPRGT